uniref:Peroxiredoxin-5 n=1 Tax=Rhodnius neglectus TaxID=72488 RepID=A0A0P4VNZ4_9HEMI
MHSLVHRGPVRLISSFLYNKFHTSTSANMPIQIGDKIPSVDLYENTQANKVNIEELCAGKKVVLFAVPGAFTPGCSKTHLPGYVNDADDLKSKGVGEIICVSVNDPFVMAAWAQDQKTEGKVRMLADPNACFTKALELETEIAPLGGIRSKRYSMVIDDGIVKAINVEPDGTGLACSLSKNIEV